ncbi:MAG: SulP family inorganic anion transporter [Planctomycetaceae bacterium]|nr:SulP family inorganic anion transporter [Planctomycetaceae bacterium]
MPNSSIRDLSTLPRDLTSGLVVFLVALPLCLGIALASNAPLFSGLLAGIVGGLVIGALSGSHTSVSGPAAGLTAIVAAQIAALGSFEAFLFAVVIAGVIQVGLGLCRAGFISAFFPSSVIKGLLAAIGVILILKQIPHLLGHDADPEGEMAFRQPDHENTFSEFGELLFDIHPGAAAIGLASIAVLVLWDRIKFLKKSVVPGPLVVVVLGTALSLWLSRFSGRWSVTGNHLVQVPVAESLVGLTAFFQHPDFAQWTNPAVYYAGATIAIVASLETLLNLEAVDKLDPQQRTTPPNRELLAQGIGNVAVGLLGGIPVTAVIVRGSVNINAGAATKRSAIFHGLLLLVSVAFLPMWLNLIPLSCLAAILLVTGVKLASPALFMAMWRQGRYQFAPFIITVVAIVFSDLLIGVLIGLAVSLGFILNSNLRRPLKRFIERQLGGDVVHIELANQVSFLNRGVLSEALDRIPRGGQVLLNAQHTDYIDPDVLDLIRDFKEHTAPAREIRVSLLGFRAKYQLDDQIEYVDHSTRELQSLLTPTQVLKILKDGHERFRTGRRLTRDFDRQIAASGDGQHPLAVVLSCIDSRTPAELLFDLGVGDIFSVRIAGNTTSRKVLGSIEYGCAVAGAKLVLVMGHTRCGAVTTAVRAACTTEPIAQLTGCQHVEHILQEIQACIDDSVCQRIGQLSDEEQAAFVDLVARDNVLRTVEVIQQQSQTLDRLAREGRIVIVGTLYDVVTGDFTFWTDDDDEVDARSNGQAMISP